jgi:creatinine amidohydrolase
LNAGAAVGRLDFSFLSGKNSVFSGLTLQPPFERTPMTNPFLSPLLRRLALAIGACAIALAPLQAQQVRKLHSRDLIRLSQPQVTEYLKRSDIIFIPVGAVETNGIMPGGRDWVAPLAYAMAMAEEIDALYMPGLPWSYPGTTMTSSGTINISPTQGLEFLRATAEALWRQGFRRQVYITSGHGPAPLTVGTLVREFFDSHRVPLLYIEMGEQLSRLQIPAPQRNRLIWGAHHITGRLIDLPLKGDYGDASNLGPVPQNPGMVELGKLGFAGSERLGSWITDDRAHGGGGANNLPATEAEREEWGKQGEAQIRAIVKALKLPEAMKALREHDKYTNEVIGPKFEKVLPPAVK